MAYAQVRLYMYFFLYKFSGRGLYTGALRSPEITVHKLVIILTTVEYLNKPIISFSTMKHLLVVVAK